MPSFAVVIAEQVGIQLQTGIGTLVYTVQQNKKRGDPEAIHI